MKHWQLSGSTALALLLSSSAALAVTPEEVWTNWQAVLSGSGALTGGATTRNGDTLEATGVTWTLTNSDDASTVSTVFDKITFRDLGDGTVEITLPTSYPFTLTGGESDDPASFNVTTPTDGLRMIASGTAEATSYDFSADTYGLTADGFKKSSGEAIDLTIKAAMTGVAGKYAVTPGAGITGIDSSGKAASTTIDVVAKEPATDTEATFAITVGETSGTTKGTFVGQEMMANMSQALKAGFMVDSTSNIGPVTVKGNVVEGGKTTTIDATLGGLTSKVAIDSARVDYGFAITGFDGTVTGPDMPLPEVSSAFGELAFGVMLPVAMTDTPQDFTMLFKLADLTAADGLWAMFDPGSQLKRDPATLILDLKGKGRWTADIMDPAVQDQAAPPLELASLDLPQLLLKALGGEIAATGALTFDNSDLMTYGGLPAPTGKITANLKGINALIDTAVSMGLIPEEEVMGVRMGLAMFAKPGAGPDELVSEVEFKDKHLFVNGQQLQ